MTNVLKIGGNQLDDPAFIAELARILHERDEPCVIVHGGGKGIKALQERFGIPAQYIDGLRVTDEQTLELVMMQLIGVINPMLVAAFVKAGVHAVGLNGADARTLRAAPMTSEKGELGRVGKIMEVNTEFLHSVLARRFTPVIAPVAYGYDGGFFNINADQAAGAVAAALPAERVIFLTDVPGVLDEGKHLIKTIGHAKIKSQIQDGVITGGMAIKVNAALDAIAAGAGAAVITNLEGFVAGTGTVVGG
jgi:acetylglutamate kinase